MKKDLFIYAVYLNEEDNIFLVGIKNLRELSDFDLINSKCVLVDIESKEIQNPRYYLSHLKYESWGKIEDKKSEEVIMKIKETFTEKEIEEKIIKPLMKDEEEQK